MEYVAQIVIDTVLLTAVLLLWLKGRSECERADEAWHSIAEMRWDLDSLTINHSRLLKILMDEVGVEVGYTTEQYPTDRSYGPREYYISKFNPPHPDAD